MERTALSLYCDQLQRHRGRKRADGAKNAHAESAKAKTKYTLVWPPPAEALRRAARKIWLELEKHLPDLFSVHIRRGRVFF